MALSKKERDKSEEEVLTVALVNSVRDFDDENSFARLRAYVDSYIKLFGRRYRIPGCDSDEIEQECLYALRYKAINDFNEERGKFRTFAILCIKRHLFSLIKSSKQQKRRVQNESLSLDEDRSDNENLSLSNLVVDKGLTPDKFLEKIESEGLKKSRLFAKLSTLERHVVELYLKRYRYDEIVEKLRKKLDNKRIDKKTIDNSLQRARNKAQNLAEHLDWI